jgi:DNA repair ATPase RecN
VIKEAGTARLAELGGSARVDELSRMLSGMPTDEAASHAEELLSEAAREKA